MEIPTIKIPPVDKIETISIPLPTADVPSYVPLVVPPSDLREPEGTKPVQTAEPPAPVLQLPGLPPVPIPPAEVLGPTVITAVSYTHLTLPTSDLV